MRLRRRKSAISSASDRAVTTGRPDSAWRRPAGARIVSASCSTSSSRIAAAGAKIGHEGALERLRAEVRSEVDQRASVALEALRRSGLVEELAPVLELDARAEMRDLAAAAIAEVGGDEAEAEMKAFTQGQTHLNSAYGFNFLYADKVLHLPSLNEMKDLVLGSKAGGHSGASGGGSGSAKDQIYFIGG